MVKSEVIRKRLNKLDENLEILEEIKRYSFSEFISDPEHYGSAERFLQLSIEILNDIGNHIIADEELGMINWQSDIPEILYKNKYISNELKTLGVKEKVELTDDNLKTLESRLTRLKWNLRRLVP